MSTKPKEAYAAKRRIYWLDYEEEPKPHIRTFMAAHQHAIDFFGGADADEFMIAVAQEAGCFPPKIFTDPAAHLLDEMKDVVAFPLAKTTMKVDLLADIRTRLQQHGKQLKLGFFPSATFSGDTANIRNINPEETTLVAPSILSQ